MRCLLRAGAVRLAAATGLGKPNHYAVRGSVLLGDGHKPPEVGAATQAMAAPTNPQQVARDFGAQQVVGTRAEPTWKLSRAALCGTCRQPLHPGPCRRPPQTPPQGSDAKAAEFNFGLLGEDASSSSRGRAADMGDVGLIRARNDDPAMTAGTAHRMTQPGTQGDASLSFAGRWNKTSDEDRGPTVNPRAGRPGDLAQVSPDVDADATVSRLFGHCTDTFDGLDGAASSQGDLSR